MIKTLTLDTDNLFGESANFYIEIINNETNIHSIEYPIFTELMDGLNHTGIYSCLVDLVYGNYHITIKHNTVDNKGSIQVVIDDNNHNDLEDNIMEIMKDTTDGVSFA